jgi:5'-3' exonuclease
LLTGDAVDSIPGCPGIGPVKAFKILSGCDTPEEMENACMTQYKAKYGDMWADVMLA